MDSVQNVDIGRMRRVPAVLRGFDGEKGFLSRCERQQKANAVVLTLCHLHTLVRGYKQVPTTFGWKNTSGVSVLPYCT